MCRLLGHGLVRMTVPSGTISAWKMQVASTKNPSLGGVRIVVGRTGMADLSGGGSGISVTNAGSKVYLNSNASSRPKNLGNESDSVDELESDDDDDIIIYHSDFNSCSNKIKTWQYAYAYISCTKQRNAWMPSMTFMKKSNGNEREKKFMKNKHNNNHSMKSETRMEYFTYSEVVFSLCTVFSILMHASIAPSDPFALHNRLIFSSFMRNASINGVHL